jgi:phosphoribosylformylglycinamidine synthase subunit PurQ / glutaminase
MHPESKPRVMVLRSYGFNCEEETQAGYQRAGAEAEIVFASDWFADRASLSEFELLHIPGGFSFGDDLGSGKVFANKMRSGKFPNGASIWAQIIRFLENGGVIVGACNGFQVLVRAGLTPNIAGNFEQEVSLAGNESGHFENRWVRCATRGMGTRVFGARTFELPVRHGEGRLLFANPMLRSQARELGLVGLAFVDREARDAATYPANPNGSEGGATGLFSRDQQVFGLMPHPEAYLLPENHPAWATYKRRGSLAAEGEGVSMLRALVALHRGKSGSPKELT